MHKNSILTYDELESYLSGRRGQVYNYLVANGEATDRQIKEGLGYDDMNMVRPRVTELVQFGIVVECGDTVDKRTSRPVRIVKVA